MMQKFALSAAAAVAAAFVLTVAQPKDAAAAEEVATFAGGCFWCVESDFDHVPGVLKTVSGYTGGFRPDPTYQTHSSTGHREVVQITFDPAKVSYERLLHIFWRSVDPTDKGGQFCDRGRSYTTAVYANNPEQLKLAKASKAALEKSGILKKPIATEVAEARKFYKAEDYHQNYHAKNPVRYRIYRYGCGRDKKVRALWGGEAHAGIQKPGS